MTCVRDWLRKSAHTVRSTALKYPLLRFGFGVAASVICRRRGYASAERVRAAKARNEG